MDINSVSGRMQIGTWDGREAYFVFLNPLFLNHVPVFYSGVKNHLKIERKGRDKGRKRGGTKINTKQGEPGITCTNCLQSCPSSAQLATWRSLFRDSYSRGSDRESPTTSDFSTGKGGKGNNVVCGRGLRGVSKLDRVVRI